MSVLAQQSRLEDSCGTLQPSHLGGVGVDRASPHNRALSLGCDPKGSFDSREPHTPDSETWWLIEAPCCVLCPRTATLSNLDAMCGDDVDVSASALVDPCGCNLTWGSPLWAGGFCRKPEPQELGSPCCTAMPIPHFKSVGCPGHCNTTGACL